MGAMTDGPKERDTFWWLMNAKFIGWLLQKKCAANMNWVKNLNITVEAETVLRYTLLPLTKTSFIPAQAMCFDFWNKTI